MMTSTLRHFVSRAASAIVKSSATRATVLLSRGTLHPVPHRQRSINVPFRSFHQSVARYSNAGLTAPEYAKLSDATMEAVYEALDLYAEEHDGVDVDYSSGVITFVTATGTYVFNKQPPNKQIWLSSPVSGPFQYAFDRETKEWVDIRGSGDTLKGLVSREIGVEISDEF
ncbi:Frataxin-like domain-containing protein [Trichophaea hybrida]|nr:Frataxin-like domain-containing protein [Trichophaea hybrida]